MPDVDDAFDPQDEAETFDETHSVDEWPTGAAPDDGGDDPMLLTDVFDVTAARGDADDDEADEYETADDYDDDGLRALELDDDDDADQDDSLELALEDRSEDDPGFGLDRLADRTAERAAPIEPGLVYVEDIDRITLPRDDEVEKYETTRELSDEQLAELGYLDEAPKRETSAMKDEAQTVSTKEEGSRNWEERSFGADPEEALLEGSGASADDVADEADPGDDERLDEGLEETFPASDPVSAKHIT